MPNDLKAQKLREYACAGADARLKELRGELASIMKIFPHLQFGAAVSPGMPDGADTTVKDTTRRRVRIAKRHGWSPAARKAVSERMKRYWAERRKAKAQVKRRRSSHTSAKGIIAS